MPWKNTPVASIHQWHPKKNPNVWWLQPTLVAGNPTWLPWIADSRIVPSTRNGNDDVTVCELENGHWNRECSHQKWWFSIQITIFPMVFPLKMVIYQRLSMAVASSVTSQPWPWWHRPGVICSLLKYPISPRHSPFLVAKYPWYSYETSPLSIVKSP